MKRLFNDISAAPSSLQRLAAWPPSLCDFLCFSASVHLRLRFEMRNRWVTLFVSLKRCLMTVSHSEEKREHWPVLTSCRGHSASLMVRAFQTCVDHSMLHLKKFRLNKCWELQLTTNEIPADQPPEWLFINIYEVLVVAAPRLHGRAGGTCGTIENHIAHLLIAHKNDWT